MKRRRVRRRRTLKTVDPQTARKARAVAKAYADAIYQVPLRRAEEVLRELHGTPEHTKFASLTKEIDEDLWAVMKKVNVLQRFTRGL